MASSSPGATIEADEAIGTGVIGRFTRDSHLSASEVDRPTILLGEVSSLIARAIHL